VTGFYGSGRSKSGWLYVFAYDQDTQDATWLWNAGEPMIDEEPEFEWPFPDDPEEFGEWCQQYSFQAIPAKQARAAVLRYLEQLHEYLRDSMEMFDSPVTSVGFVRAVRNMINELEEIA
jgi:hypothetical protein